MARLRKSTHRDILEIAHEMLDQPPPVTTFGYLFDAALRALRPLHADDPGRVDVLNRAMDMIFAELGGTPSGLPGVVLPATSADRAGVSRFPRPPALKPKH